jgi:ribulose-phosphate 3-epimerase
MKGSEKPKNIIAASILSADFGHLGDSIKRAIDAGVDYIHFDVMDNHFVPNLSFGAVVCQSLRKHIHVPIDVHLMVDRPESFIQPFSEAGANLLTFHPETVLDVAQTIAKIRAAGMKAGLAFNPEKPLVITKEILCQIDLLLIMSVNPGFGGQAFMAESIEKVKQARHLLDQANSNAFLGIDGGIKVDNVGAVARAGADFIVIGSGLFHAADYHRVVSEMRLQL